MLNKFIVLYSLLITINNPTKAADVNKSLNNKTENRQDVWKPLIQTHKWLPQPPVLQQNSNSIIKSADNEITYNSHLYNNDKHHNQEEQQYMQHISGSGNSVKPLIKPLVQMPTPITYSQPGKQLKLKPFLLKTIVNNDSQRWQLHKLLNNTVKPYTQITTSQVKRKSQKNGENSITSQLNLHHVTDIKNVQNDHQQSQNQLPYWHSLKQLNDNQQQRYFDISSTNSYKIENKIIKTKLNLKNATHIPLIKTTANIKINGISNDYESTSNPYDNFHKKEQNNDSKTKNAAVSVGDNGKHSSVKSMPLGVVLSNKQKFYDIKRDMMTRNNKAVTSNKSENKTNDIEFENYKSKLYNDQGKTINKSQPRLIKFPTQHLVLETTSATATTDSVAEKIDLVNIGRHLLKRPSSRMLAADTQHQGKSWSLLTATQTQIPLPLSDMSTTKSLSTEIVSGRKAKKVKKKLKKFILPLLLAYKLKFIALLPLLVGGLVLLVGTTGMAGFFFALFTAVMSLKATSRNAIVVKK